MKKEFAKIVDAFHKLNFILSKEQKKYSILVLLMALISAMLEMMGVSILLPLLDAFLSPETLADKSYIRPFVQLLHLKSANEIILTICIAMILLYVLKNVYNSFYCWVSSKFSCKIKRELSVEILSAYMKQGYSFFVKHNSSQLLRGIGNDVSNVYVIIVQLFNLFSKFLTLVSITALIIVVTPKLSFFLLGLVVFCFALTQLIFRKPMQKYGQISRYYQYRCYQTSLEAIQGSKEVLVTNRQSYFVKEYEKCMIEENKANVRMSIGAATPAYIIEAICITGLMSAVAIQMTIGGHSLDLLSQLSVLAVAAFRILPSLGAILSSVNSIVYSAPALSAAYDTLYLVKNLEKNSVTDEIVNAKNEYSTAEFTRQIELSNITFSYENDGERNQKVIDGISLTIKKGTSVALIGASGSGKTTLSDILLGLFKPQEGIVLMDGIDINKLEGRWNQIVGYVPQSIYLTDTTIRQNIAFGVAKETIDDDKIWKALEMAQLREFVEALPDKLDTRVGEWGVQFSGGQRQRVAIARALYSEPDILVLDEATAALDTETETAVMEAIDALQGVKTLIIIAHRLTTIKNCDEIYRITGGKAVKVEKSQIFKEEGSD